MIEKAGVPEFAFAAGLTQALDGFGKTRLQENNKDNPTKDAVETDRDFSSSLTNIPSTKE